MCLGKVLPTNSTQFLHFSQYVSTRFNAKYGFYIFQAAVLEALNGGDRSSATAGTTTRSHCCTRLCENAWLAHTRKEGEGDSLRHAPLPPPRAPFTIAIAASVYGYAVMDARARC